MYIYNLKSLRYIIDPKSRGSHLFIEQLPGPKAVIAVGTRFAQDKQPGNHKVGE